MCAWVCLCGPCMCVCVCICVCDTGVHVLCLGPGAVMWGLLSAQHTGAASVTVVCDTASAYRATRAVIAANEKMLGSTAISKVQLAPVPLHRCKLQGKRHRTCHVRPYTHRCSSHSSAPRSVHPCRLLRTALRVSTIVACYNVHAMLTQVASYALCKL